MGSRIGAVDNRTALLPFDFTAYLRENTQHIFHVVNRGYSPNFHLFVREHRGGKQGQHRIFRTLYFHFSE